VSDLDVLLAHGAAVPGRVGRGDVAALAALYAWPDASGADAGAEAGSTSGRRAWVRANMVTSLDGATAGEDGRSGTVSSDVDREVFRVLRGQADAVLVGAGTARTEGYGPATVNEDLLAERRGRGARDAAVVVQVSRSGRVEAGRGMFDEPGAGLVVLPDGDAEAYERAVAAAGRGAVLLAGHVDTGGVDLAAALAALADRGLTRVLCEGGPALLGDLASADLLDELCLTTSPVVVAGDGARAVVGDAVDPRRYRLAGLLHGDGTLLARWQRDR
jgi:riboflavin biosynthesis pyrimidine reductase